MLGSTPAPRQGGNDYGLRRLLAAAGERDVITHRPLAEASISLATLRAWLLPQYGTRRRPRWKTADLRALVEGWKP
jgi:hypothetical protein